MSSLPRKGANSAYDHVSKKKIHSLTGHVLWRTFTFPSNIDSLRIYDFVKFLFHSANETGYLESGTVLSARANNIFPTLEVFVA